MAYRLHFEYPFEVVKETLLEFLKAYLQKSQPIYIAIGTLQVPQPVTHVFVETKIKFERAAYSKNHFLEFQGVLPTRHKNSRQYGKFQDLFANNNRLDKISHYHLPKIIQNEQAPPNQQQQDLQQQPPPQNQPAAAEDQLIAEPALPNVVQQHPITNNQIGNNSELDQLKSAFENLQTEAIEKDNTIYGVTQRIHVFLNDLLVKCASSSSLYHKIYKSLFQNCLTHLTAFPFMLKARHAPVWRNSKGGNLISIQQPD